MIDRLSHSDSLRKVILPLLAKLDVDLTIRHHWTRDRMSVNAFKHRGYWFYGRKRERETMLSFLRLVEATDVIYDVGAHIGYMSLYFARLAPMGAVHAFEPSPGNLRYLRCNVRSASNVVVVPAAAGDAAGEAEMWEDALSGQNNTLLPDLMSIPQTERHTHVPARAVRVRVPTIRLDDYIDALGFSPDFVKMDVEGFELQALTGAAQLLRSNPPKLLIEITRNAPAVMDLLERNGYRALGPSLRQLDGFSQKPRNTFFLHTEVHQPVIQRLRVNWS